MGLLTSSLLVLSRDVSRDFARDFSRSRRTTAVCVAASWLALACSSGSTTGTTTTGTGGTSGGTSTAPGAPTNLVATPSNGGGSLAFTAPSTGGSAITGYTATCTAGSTTVTGTSAASPVAVTGLTNGTAYSCTVVAKNAIGTGTASAAVSLTPAVPTLPAGSTAAIGCPLSNNSFNSSTKVNAYSVWSWSCGTVRTLTGNGIPEHAVTGGNFATPIGVQNISMTFTLTPNNTGTVTQSGDVGYVWNSVKLDPGTAGTCTSTATSVNPGGGCVAAAGTDPWRIEALGGAFTFGTDENNAHVQPNGQYHYHGMPEGEIARLGKGTGLALVAWARDGFPIYARYGYIDANNAASGTRAMRGSWQKKAAPDAGRPSTTIFAMGTFMQDYEYVAGSGDLDQCNGRTGVTPEFPNGIYHYYITDTYPYIQRCYKGVSITGVGGPGGPGGPP